MYWFALAAHGLACCLAYDLVRHPKRARPGCWIAGVWILVIGYLAVIAWPWFGSGERWVVGSKQPVQLGVIMLYGFLALLLPSGILRLIGGSRPIAVLAVFLTAIAPIILFVVGHYLSGTEGDRTQGMGMVRDLLFLSPGRMGSSMNRMGLVVHLYRVHFLVLGATVLASSLLHLIPVREQLNSESP